MKHLFLFLILILTAFSAEAQKYIPFPTLKDSAIWRGSGSGRGRDDGTEYWVDGTTFIDYDTVVNGKSYHHLKGIYWFITKDRIATLKTEDNVGFFREEDKKIYFYQFTAPEYVLYDFNLKEGDILSQEPNSSYYSKIIKIDSVLLQDSLYHRRFTYGAFKGNDTIPNTQKSYIEGIGSLANSRFAGKIECFTSNNIHVYKRGEKSYCGKLGAANYNIMVGVEDAFLQKVEFNIFPNPSTGQFTIQTQSIFGDSYICVRDVLGRIILQEKLQFENQTFNISSQPKGLYFIELRSGNNSRIQKLILE